MEQNNYHYSIIGHADILNMLKKAISNNRLSHSYLFLGPAHIGKETLAVYFAQILQCQSKNKPCMTCSSCEQIIVNNHPDTQIIKSQDTIKIEEIRNLQHNLNLNSFNALYKIAIIIDADKMTKEAQNAFLKTLEEPPGKTILILTTDSENKLLPTIISRCQSVAFRNVHTAEIEKALKLLKLSARKAEELSRLANGKPGLILPMAKDPNLLSRRDEQIKLILNLNKTSQLEKFNRASEISQKGTGEVKSFLDFWLSWVRDILLIRLKLSDSIINTAHFEVLKKESSFYSIDDLRNFISKIEAVKKSLNYNVNLKLLLETLFLGITTN